MRVVLSLMLAGLFAASPALPLEAGEFTVAGHVTCGGKNVEARVKVYSGDKFVLYTDADTSGCYSVEGLSTGGYSFCFIYRSRESVLYCDTLVDVKGEAALDVSLKDSVAADESTPLRYLEYEKDVAEYDIAHGEINLIWNGLPSPYMEQCPCKFDSLREAYGFRVTGFGDAVTPVIERMTDSYNGPVEQYLAERNGDDWEQRYSEDYHSMIASIKLLSPLNVVEFKEYLYNNYDIPGKAVLRMVINNKGEIVHWWLEYNSITHFKEILEKEIHRLKFTSFSCKETQTVGLLFSH